MEHEDIFMLSAVAPKPSRHVTTIKSLPSAMPQALAKKTNKKKLSGLM